MGRRQPEGLLFLVDKLYQQSSVLIKGPGEGALPAISTGMCIGGTLGGGSGKAVEVVTLS